MNNSEKLFKAINDIDEKLIDEAKDEEQKPVQIKTKKRLPIKETALFAACFAVLAGVVFGIVKYRIDHDIQTAEKNSNSLSDLSGSSDISNSVPKPELTFTDEDRELQAILKDLTAKCGEIDRMFYQMNVIDGEPDLKTEWGDYYIIPEGLRTEPGGLFAVPRSVGEMEELIHKVFSSDAAEFYLQSDNVCKGRFTEDSVGNVLFEPDDIHAGANPTFIEVDGKMYRSSLEWDDYSSSYSRLGIDCDTAKVTRRSDKAMEFSYRGYDYPNRFDGGDVYAERNGAVVYEDGAWKLHYFYRQGFIPEMPVEYTEQDLELHAILDALEPGNDVRALFSLNSAPAEGTEYKFILPGNYEPEGSYQYYIDVSGPQTITNHPKSLSELEDMLLKYFTREAADNYMSRTCRGTMTENDDGIYSVTLDKDVFDPVYIEIDGKMFYHTSAASGYAEFLNTAKVADWTDDMIICTYVCAAPGGYSTETEALRYERGGWKFDPFYDPEADNAAVKSALDDLLPKAAEIDGMFAKMNIDGDTLTFNMGGDPNEHKNYYQIPEGKRTEPNGLFEVPRTYAGMEELLGECFSSHGAASYMEYVSKGTLTEKSDGTYDFMPDSGYEVYEPIFIEANGRMYRSYFMSSNDNFGQGLDTAKFTDKTNNAMEFEYTGIDKYTDYFADKNGVLVKENGEWKLHYDRDMEFLPVFTEEDLELQGILKELAPGHEVFQWIFNGGWGDTEYNFFFGEDQQYGNVYYPLPKGKAHYYDRLENPQSYEDMRQLLNRYFTKASAEGFMNYVGKGAMTERADGSYLVTLEDFSSGTEAPSLIEIDGKMYIAQILRGGIAAPDFENAKIIEKTDNTITFSCGGINGLIKREENGWRLNYAYRGMIEDDLG